MPKLAKYQCENEFGVKKEGVPPCQLAKDFEVVEMPYSEGAIDGKGPKCPNEDCQQPMTLIEVKGGDKPLKKILTVVGALLLVIFLVMGVSKFVSGGDAELKCSDTINFGKTGIGATNEQYFSIRNKGKDVLKIKSIEFEDSSFSVANKVSEVQSKKRAEIIVRFKPTRNGEVKSTMTITTNCRLEKETKVKLIGEGGSLNVMLELDNIVNSSSVVK